VSLIFLHLTPNMIAEQRQHLSYLETRDINCFLQVNIFSLYVDSGKYIELRLLNQLFLNSIYPRI